jgi:hypothetical protein
MEKRTFIAEIIKLLKRCDDVSFLGLILILLQKYNKN